MDTVLNNNYQKRIDRSLAAALQQKTNKLNTFVYTTSHNIRDPLSSIIGLVNVAMSETEDRETLMYFKVITDYAKQVDNALQELLQMPAIGQGEINVENIDTNIFLKSIINAFSSNPQIKNIHVRTLVNGVGSLCCDPRFLRLILHNLIDNSIKYRNENGNGYIHIALHRSEQQVMIEISDNGIGIAGVLQRKIVEIFAGGSERSSEIGIGLYMADKLVKKLGGKIDFYSEEMKGSTFKVYLPDILIE